MANRGPEAAPLHLLPTLWFRNTWSWGRDGRGLLAAAAAMHGAARPRSILAARDARPVPVRVDAAARRRRGPRAPLHRERDERRAAVRLRRTAPPYVKDAFHDYVVDGEPTPSTRPDAARRRRRTTAWTLPAGRRGRRAAAPDRASAEPWPASPLRRAFDARLRRRARRRPTLSTPTRLAGGRRRRARRGRARPTRACCGPSSSTTTSCADWLEGDPAPAAAARRARGDGRNARLAAPLQPRRHLHARQVGVPVVRGVGPGLPHDPVRAHRPALRQGAAGAVSARMVHASERPAPGLRVRASAT